MIINIRFSKDINCISAHLLLQGDHLFWLFWGSDLFVYSTTFFPFKQQFFFHEYLILMYSRMSFVAVCLPRHTLGFGWFTGLLRCHGERESALYTAAGNRVTDISANAITWAVPFQPKTWTDATLCSHRCDHTGNSVSRCVFERKPCRGTFLMAIYGGTLPP